MRDLPTKPEVWLHHGGFLSRIEPNMQLEVRFPDGCVVVQTHDNVVARAQEARQELILSLQKLEIPEERPLLGPDDGKDGGK